jgi:hypothetical protein
MLKKIALAGFFAFVSTVSTSTANVAGTKSAGPVVTVGAPVARGLCYMYMCH